MPGVGAQGGEVGAIRAALDAHGGGVLPSASRSVLYAGGGDGYEKAAAQAASALRQQANDARALSAGR
jgi:orotidine-5'-phosphate decarboxylase